MSIFELSIISLIIVGCIAGMGWAFRDLISQVKMMEERCESLEEDDE